MWAQGPSGVGMCCHVPMTGTRTTVAMGGCAVSVGLGIGEGVDVDECSGVGNTVTGAAVSTTGVDGCDALLGRLELVDPHAAMSKSAQANRPMV